MTFKEKFMVEIHAVWDADWFQPWPHFSSSCLPAPCNVTLLLLPEVESISPPRPLSLGWPFDLFWPLDCNRSNSGPVPSPSLKCTLPLAFLEPAFRKGGWGEGERVCEVEMSWGHRSLASTGLTHQLTTNAWASPPMSAGPSPWEIVNSS